MAFCTATAAAGASTQLGRSSVAFRMLDHRGATVTEAALKGRPSVLYFGFTHCPVVCPTTLFEFGEILDALRDDAARFNFAFVTVDPERDTPSFLQEYLGNFDPRITGLSGTAEVTEALAKSVGASFARQETPQGPLYDHSVTSFLLDSDGQPQGSLYIGSDSDREHVVKRLRLLLDAGRGLPSQAAD